MTNPDLTDREHQALRCVAEGGSHDDIARAMFISTSTVKTLLRQAYAKLHARNAAHAVHIGWQRGLLGRTQPSTGRPQAAGTNDPQGMTGRIAGVATVPGGES